MHDLPDIEEIMRKFFDLHGGEEKFFEAAQKRLAEFNARWDQDIGAIGRVLRSHLIVEYYMTAYLQAANPNLGIIDDAKIGFAQKVDLLGDHDAQITNLVPGIRRLNTVRNRLTHNLSASVTQDDVNSLMSVGFYRVMRSALEKGHQKLGTEPLDIYDHFAQLTASTFHHASSGDPKNWHDVSPIEEK